MTKINVAEKSGSIFSLSVCVIMPTIYYCVMIHGRRLGHIVSVKFSWGNILFIFDLKQSCSSSISQDGQALPQNEYFHIYQLRVLSNVFILIIEPAHS